MVDFGGCAAPPGKLQGFNHHPKPKTFNSKPQASNPKPPSRAGEVEALEGPEAAWETGGPEPGEVDRFLGGPGRGERKTGPKSRKLVL